MTGPLTKLRNRFSNSEPANTEADAEDEPETPDTTLHECTACGSVFIQHSGDRCSQCGSGPLEAQ